MQTSPTDSTFLKQNNTDHICLALGAIAIVVFLAVTFFWFDATSLPPNNSTIGETHQPAVKQRNVDQPAPSQDLIAVTNSPILKAPFEFTSHTQGSLAYGNLNATFALDNRIWRYTTDGWQDISNITNRAQTPTPLLENVHPAIWTAMLFLSSLLLLIMACSDQDIERLFSRDAGNKA